MRFQPLGDQALLDYCTDEQAALALSARVRDLALPWIVDVVQAYASVAFYLDVQKIELAQAAAVLNGIDATAARQELAKSGQVHVIPCCYDMGLDLEKVAQASGLQAQEVIRLHSGQLFTVYAIGFCPGFPYMGYLPDVLSRVPRLPTPRLSVEAGSVGLTGRQTGIYTMDRPGGWNIVGRTPLQLVDVAAGYFPLRTGDRVQFRPIDTAEYRAQAGQKLLV